jgi:hypothetical protein
MPADRYHAFLLRIWRIDAPEQPAWRASLEDPHTREVARFDSLEALLAYLRALDSEECSAGSQPARSAGSQPARSAGSQPARSAGSQPAS